MQFDVAQPSRPVSFFSLWVLGSSRRLRRSRATAMGVIYEIDDAGQTVTVLHVGHRRDIYK